jgi:tetratricopeptide (TPR) repeat protein
MAYQMLGKWSDSLPYAERLAALKPNDNAGRLRLGFALYNTGSYPEALKIFEEIKTAYENDGIFLEYLGGTLENLDDREAAIRFYTEKSAAFPDHHYLIWRLAILYQQQGGQENMERARALFEQAIAKAPENTLYRYGAALLARDMGDPEGAKKRFEEILAIDETNDYYQNEYGSLLYALGEFRKAVEHFKRATELGESATYFSNLGYSYRQLEEEQKANEAFEKAKSLEKEVGNEVSA